jgi:GT2 family glycosyltransferase
MLHYGFNIIIPYQGNYTRLRECIGSIFLNTVKIPFVITLVDNCSKNKHFSNSFEKADKQINVIRFDQEKGYGLLLNEAIKKINAPWNVFLKPNCKIVETNWLTCLYENLNQNMKNKIGILSITSNYEESSPISKNRLDPRKNKLTVVTEPFHYVCALAPKKLFDKIGYFKESGSESEVINEMFERMKNKGYHQAVCDMSWIEFQKEKKGEIV